MDSKWLLVVSVFSINLISTIIDGQSFRSCVTPDKNTGQCIEIKKCPHLLQLLTKSLLLPDDYTYLRSSRCDTNDNSLLVCCGLSTDPPPIVPQCPTVPDITVPSKPTNTVVDGPTFGECRTPDKDVGQCVKIQNCTHLLQLLTKTPLLPDEISYLRRSQCGNHDGTVLVCCGSVPPRETMNPVPQESLPSGPTSPGNVFPEPGVCGNGLADRIFGGNATELDEFPWMVLLEYTKPQNRKGFHCGGVLINNRYVLTASHCVNGANIPYDWSLTGVRLGEWDLSTETDCELDECAEPVLNVAIEQAISHEGYNPNSKNQLNDIALLRLSQPVPYTDWIKAICLPKATHQRNSDFVGQSLDVAGWGKTEMASQSNIKLKARVDGVALENCNTTYHRHGITLSSSQICAGGIKGIDSCRGDSGGPLIGLDTTNPIRPYFYLVGVVSFGPSPCGLRGWPGVYTKVGDYIEWIEANVRP